MKIGLIDVDGHNFPNLALMKISAYHKSKGDDVEWVNFFEQYDKVYLSKVFTFSRDIDTCIQATEIIKGGTGYDIKSRLPEDIEKMPFVDFSIYPTYDIDIKFFSRGCVRNCPFCLVRQKEGYIVPCEPMPINPLAKRIEVLDNNFFANPQWEKAVEILDISRLPVNLHGVDVRTMNVHKAKALNSIRLSGSSVHIAWDNPRDNIIPKLELMLEHVKSYKITCYVLIGYWSTMAEDLYRVNKLKELGIDPFVQYYLDYDNKRKPAQYEKDFASWVNKKERFKSFDFKDFKPRKGFKCKEYFI